MPSSLSLTVINFTGARENWGCKATSFGLLEDLREALSPDFEPEFRFVPFERNATIDRFVSRIYRGRIERTLTGRESSEKLEPICRLVHQKAFSEVLASPISIFMAEGTMTGNKFVEGSRLLLLPEFVSRGLKRPVISLNQTLYSEVPVFTEQLKHVYGGFDTVMVREPASLPFAQEQLGRRDATLFPDSAFRTTASSEGIDHLLTEVPRQPYVCFCASGGYRGSHLSPALKAMIETAIAQGFGIVGLFWQESVMRDLKQLYPAMVFPKAGLDHRQIAKVLQEAIGVVGGRYHMSIVAACVRTPSVILPSGTHKSNGLLQLLQYPMPVRSFDDVSGSLEDFQQMVEKRDSLVAVIDSAMERIRQQRQEGLARLRARLLELQSSSGGVSRAR